MFLYNVLQNADISFSFVFSHKQTDTLLGGEFDVESVQKHEVMPRSVGRKPFFLFCIRNAKKNADLRERRDRIPTVYAEPIVRFLLTPARRLPCSLARSEILPSSDPPM